MTTCHTDDDNGGGRSRRGHPLDPLSAAEIEAAVATARADGRLGERVRFWGATLDEAHARDVVAGKGAAGEAAPAMA